MNQRTPTIFVTQQVMIRNAHGELQEKFDLSGAELEYGADIRVLIPHGQSLVSSVPVVRQLNEQLRDFSEDDFLLPLGDPSIMAAAAAIAARNTNGKLKVLKWDRRQGRYLCVTLDLSGKSL